ncbi:hypothetical protein [Carnimonas nigrificans]|uniref:hypothetical protein n=1 Tax=Carnimonas nigrificans TaxID=64323 RepID=UPI0004B519AD|nr:hypothetical protein [Carnimonas nigrificans]
MSDNAPLRITPVDGKADLKTFITLPSRLFNRDPAWVAPLALERRLHLTPKTNPWFEHADFQAWIAWRGNTPVGRISAQVDRLALETHQDATGFFGMLDAEDSRETFAALLTTAEQWLAERGIQRVRGPFSLSINDEVGLLIDGFDTPPMFMMGHTAPYSGPAVEECGYTKAMDLLAYIVDTSEFKTPRVVQWLLGKATGEINVRPMNFKKFDEELVTVREIFNDAWSDNWSFVPFTDEEFNDLGKTLKMLLSPDLIQIVEVDGEAAAFIVALPNLNEVIKDFNGGLLPFNWAKLLWKLKVKFPTTARVPLMGVRKKHHNTLGPALSFLAIEAVKQQLVDRGVRKIEMSWILETNNGVRGIIESIGGEVYKTYRVYEKTLSTPAINA